MAIHRLPLLGYYDRNAGDDAILLALIGTVGSLLDSRAFFYVYAPNYNTIQRQELWHVKSAFPAMLLSTCNKPIY